MTEPTRPETPPAYGKETAQAVLGIAREYPRLLNQCFWEFETQEGTKHCIAGWAQWLHEGHVTLTGWTDNHVEQAAARYLAIDAKTAHRLFHTTNNPRAIKALEYLARGEEIDWTAVNLDIPGN